MVAAALTQLPFMAWQRSQGLPLTGWTGGPGSRYAAVLLAVSLPLAPIWGQLLLGVALAFSQSFLALAAVLTALATMMEGRLRWLGLAWMVGCMAVMATFRPWPLWQERLDAWRLVLPEWSSSPWLGMGPGGWGSTVPLRQWTSSEAEKWPQAHSDLVQWGVEMGVVGMLLLLAWTVLSAGRLWRSAFRGSVVALGVLALGFHPFHSSVLAPWLLLILGAGLREPSPDVGCEKDAAWATSPSGPGLSWRYWL